ncbi:unnamed protein product [Cylicocyclus nassatus]|uniref:Uncharacterized protein n=1 Tax=Cylicocyclus nassatus TaxID=53992 RepID=A0AA36DM44_CYLNA|nr:unnamed protein product [Cylicocyclus nassatus]
MLLELLEVTLVISSAFGQGNPQMANDVPRDPYDLGIYGSVRMPDGHGSGNRMREGGMEMIPNDGMKMPYNGGMPGGKMGVPNDGMGRPELKMEPPIFQGFRIPGGGLPQDFWKGKRMQGRWPFKSMIGRQDLFKMRPMRGDFNSESN